MKKMSSKKLVRCFRHEYRLYGTRWVRFCRRYGNRDVATVIKYIKTKYGEIPVAFRTYFIDVINKGKSNSP